MCRLLVKLVGGLTVSQLLSWLFMSHVGLLVSSELKLAEVHFQYYMS